LIDRRALLVSGLAYAGGAFWTLIRQAGLSDITTPLTILNPRRIRVAAQRRMEATPCRDIEIGTVGAHASPPATNLVRVDVRMTDFSPREIVSELDRFIVAPGRRQARGIDRAA